MLLSRKERKKKMTELIVEKSEKFSDIYPLFGGYEKCEASHRYGPHTRDYYIIHFCLSGKGRLRDKYGTHEIGEGELFVIREGEATVYQADEKEPWEYVWIAFSGSACDIFSTDRSVYRFSFELAEKLKDNIQKSNASPYIYTSIIYELMALLFRENGEREDSFAQIKRYIDYKYMEKISVSELAERFSFDRSYLFKVFKARYGAGIKEYITAVRLKNAKRFLSEGASVSECAAMVGYYDEFNFSRIFKKHAGYPPSEHKRLCKPC